MAYVISPAQVSPYVVVQNQLFKDAFVANYRKARLLQRDTVFWFTSSRNYRFLAFITVSALLVLGAAICQLKAADYSSSFVHRSGANFVWSITCFCFCAVEFARIYRQRDGYWTWEVSCAMALTIAIVISALALANNVAGTINLAPGTYRAEATTPWPFYVGMTTNRWPPGFPLGLATVPATAARGAVTTTPMLPPPVMTTGFILNEWNSYQWTTWRKAVFILYCFCTIMQGIVLLLAYLPYVFFKIHEYRLGYGRRLLSNVQIYDVTKNAVRAYKAAVYNRQKLQEVLTKDGSTNVGSETVKYPHPPPQSVFKEKQPPRPPPSTLSVDNFKRAFQTVRPRSSAMFAGFKAQSTMTPSYYRYEDYYYDSSTPTTYDYYYDESTTYSSGYSTTTSTSSSTTGTRSDQQRVAAPARREEFVVEEAPVRRPGIVRRPRLVPRSALNAEPSIASVTTSNDETFTEYIPATDYTDPRRIAANGGTTSTSTSSSGSQVNASASTSSSSTGSSSGSRTSSSETSRSQSSDRNNRTRRA